MNDGSRNDIKNWRSLGGDYTHKYGLFGGQTSVACFDGRGNPRCTKHATIPYVLYQAQIA